jgi:alkylhydroperoxidase/carboxymuconolactone decarboxylase family protein YurZ
VSRLCEGCIVHHAKAAKAAGATLAEVQETLDVCVLMGGGPATVYGKKAIEAYNS